MIIVYLLIFYWIFAALFTFGAVYNDTKKEGISTLTISLGCLITGGILFPMYLGKSLNL